MSLNVITLMAFIMTLGIVVDDAIVTGGKCFSTYAAWRTPPGGIH